MRAFETPCPRNAALRRQAKRNAKRRRREAGGVLFIVAVTLAVLASLGIYALRAAATEIRTSGYARQNTQTHFLSEYGLLAASQVLDKPGMADRFWGMLLDQSRAQTDCFGLTANPPASAPQISRTCIRLSAAELGTLLSSGATVTPMVERWQGTPAPGSLGAIPVEGDFFVEISNPAAGAPLAGFANAKQCMIQFDVYATGFTFPQVTLPSSAPINNPAPTIAQYSGRTVEITRGQVSGLGTCPNTGAQ